MRRHLIALLLPLLLAVACTAQPAPPTSPPSGPTATPTLTASPTALPTPSAAATAAPTQSASPSASPSPTATASPSASPSATASPTATPSIDSAGLSTKLQEALRQQRTNYRVPGIAAAVLMPDGWLWSGAVGNAQVDPRVAATSSTPFVVGSITKTFVAALVMQLAEEGTLSLDDRLTDWLPDYPVAPEVTLRQLLAHTSGIFNYFEHKTYNERVFGEPSHVWTPLEIVTDFRRAPYFAPGAGFHYSNTGYVLLGMVIEAATGNSLGEEMRTRLFDPLGLGRTYLQGDGPPPSGAAQGYLVGRTGPRLVSDGTNYRPTTSAATVAWAAGAIVASAADLANWADTLYGGELLEPASLAEMTDFGANPYSGSSYGLGVRLRFIGSHQVMGHTGSLRGYTAAMWYFPAEDITVVVLTNRGRIDPNPIADALAQVALDAAGYAP